MPGSSGIHTYPPSTQLRFLKRNILAGRKCIGSGQLACFLGKVMVRLLGQYLDFRRRIYWKLTELAKL